MCSTNVERVGIFPHPFFKIIIMLRRSFIGILFLSILQIGTSQRTVFGILEEHVQSIIQQMPGSSTNVYADPSLIEISKFREIVNRILNNNPQVANAIAEEMEYEVVRFIDSTLPTNKEYFIIQKLNSGTKYFGTYVFNSTACRNAVIQCPHPRFDSNTGLQGAYIFARINTKALMISGTHRCNSLSPTSCSGTTSACGNNDTYRLSDIAHNDGSMFQVVTEFLNEKFEDASFIQLHGFAKLSSDPNLILSNGTRQSPSIDKIDELRSHLQNIDQNLTFKIVHIHTDWTRLTAFTNTQGRYLNEGSNPCTNNASSTTGKFIHIEQEFDYFRKNETGWAIMQNAFEQTFECISTATDEVSPLFEFTISDGSIVFDNLNNSLYTIEIYTIYGERVFAHESTKAEAPLIDSGISLIILRSNTTGEVVFSDKILLIK